LSFLQTDLWARYMIIMSIGLMYFFAERIAPSVTSY
jgi:hypothetical protein